MKKVLFVGSLAVMGLFMGCGKEKEASTGTEVKT